jgi:uncharacterized protein YggE
MKANNRSIIALIILMTTSFTILAQQNSITVQGVGKVSVENNKGSIHVRVDTQTVSANEAIGENNEKTSAVIEALVVAGIPLTNIQTSDFIFQPVFVYNAGVSELIGYNVINSLTVAVDDSSTISSLLDLIINAGASRIDRISFSADNIETLKNQALLEASANAKKQALLLAKASLVSLGKVISIRSTSEFNRNGVVVGAAAGGSSILAGNNVITAAVTIEYSIQ